MKEIVEAKVSQCREFHDVLKNAPPKAVFVESTYDDFWGSGLNIAGTKHTNKTAWPGKNMLGDIITKLSKKMKKNKNAWVTPKKKYIIQNADSHGVTQATHPLVE